MTTKRYVIKKTVSQDIYYEVYAQDDEVARHMVEMDHSGTCIQESEPTFKYRVITPDNEPEI
jgi:hypothetical protein